MHVDPDVSNKSDRVEWGHAGYQSVFRPDQAYEMVIEWLVSSGSIVSELVRSRATVILRFPCSRFGI